MMLPSNNSFPNRPPIPHQAFSISTRESEGDLSMSFPIDGGGQERRGSAQSAGSSAGGVGSDKGKGPQTFAEMGFVSKPVQDEGCLIM
jgi:hypothetical protein